MRRVRVGGGGGLAFDDSDAARMFWRLLRFFCFESGSETAAMTAWYSLGLNSLGFCPAKARISEGLLPRSSAYCLESCIHW